jgi:hypothetical protein
LGLGDNGRLLFAGIGTGERRIVVVGNEDDIGDIGSGSRLGTIVRLGSGAVR